MTKKTATETKGNSDDTKQHQESKPEPLSSESPRVVQHWMGICIAILAFAVGIICPPMLNHFQGPISSRKQDNTTNQQPQHRRAMTNMLDSHGASSTATHSINFQTRGVRTQQYPCTAERLAEFVHDEAVAGFHILCLNYANSDDGTTDTPSILHLDIRVGGTERTGVIHREMEGPVDWDAFKIILQDTASLQSSVQTDFQPWALFTPEGERLFDALAVEDPSSGETLVDVLAKDVGMVLAFAGGQWLWPGVRIGFKRDVSLYSIMPGNPPQTFNKNQTATLETLSLIPLVLSVEGFLTKEECRLIQVLLGRMVVVSYFSPYSCVPSIPTGIG